MKIAVVLNAHGNTPIVADTIDAIKTWVSDEILMVVDGAKWEEWGKDVKLPVYKLQGFYHNYPRAPYRNLTFGLKTAIDHWKDYDWICYCEYDVLFTSSEFKKELADAQKHNVWCVGNDLRYTKYNLPFLDKIFGRTIEKYRYLLGCCVFYQTEFLNTLNRIGFFDRFLGMTNEFNEGYFPDYEEQGGYDFGEHLYPTMAAELGGTVGQFAYWNQFLDQWGGNFQKYPMRWKPEIAWKENYPTASILHPVKESDLRWFHRCLRNRKKKYGNLQT